MPKLEHVVSALSPSKIDYSSTTMTALLDRIQSLEAALADAKKELSGANNRKETEAGNHVRINERFDALEGGIKQEIKQAKPDYSADFTSIAGGIQSSADGLQKAISGLEKGVKGYTSAVNNIKMPEIPEVKFPEQIPTDLGPVHTQLKGISDLLQDIGGREAPVVEDKPKEWDFAIKRSPGGAIRSVKATAKT